MLLTVDDLLELPDDDGRRHELVDGILIVSPPPSVAHQEIAHQLRELLAASAPDGWRVRTEFPLLFAEDTLRVPDVMAFRHPLEHGSPNPSFVIAPADVGLVVEVVSPSSRRTDRFAKPGGVRRRGHHALLAGRAGAHPCCPSVRAGGFGVQDRWRDHRPGSCGHTVG